MLLFTRKLIFDGQAVEEVTEPLHALKAYWEGLDVWPEHK